MQRAGSLPSCVTPCPLLLTLAASLLHLCRLSAARAQKAEGDADARALLQALVSGGELRAGAACNT